jgi:hypothetical protein
MRTSGIVNLAADVAGDSAEKTPVAASLYHAPIMHGDRGSIRSLRGARDRATLQSVE